MYINANKITVTELEEELNKRNLTVIATDGRISSVQQEENDVETA